MKSSSTIKILIVAATTAIAAQASAITLVEDFSGPFPAWESGWLGTNSNLTNYYGVGSGRGNNATGLWIDDGDAFKGTDNVEIVFDSLFGASLSDLSIDLASHASGFTLQVFDMNGSILLDTSVSTGETYSEIGTIPMPCLLATASKASLCSLTADKSKAMWVSTTSS